MPDIPETYLGAHLRLALFLEDHPEAPEPKYGTGLLSEIGVPPSWGGDTEGVWATIACARPDGSWRSITGWKPLIEEKWVGERNNNRNPRRIERIAIERRDPDLLDQWQTHALGRALKRAGYPADSRDIKAIMHFRQRIAENAAIAAGHDPFARGAAAGTDAFDAAGKAGEPEEDGHQPGQYGMPERPDGQPAPPEGVTGPPAQPDDGRSPTPHRLLTERAAAAGASQALSAFVADRYPGISMGDLTAGQLRTVEAWVAAAEKRAGTNPAKSTPSAPDSTAPGPESPAESSTPTEGEGGSDRSTGPSGDEPRSVDSLRALVMAEMAELDPGQVGEVKADMTRRRWSSDPAKLSRGQCEAMLNEVLPAHQPDEPSPDPASHT